MRGKIDAVMLAVDDMIQNHLGQLFDCPFCYAELGDESDEPWPHDMVNGEACPLGRLIDAYGAWCE